MDLKLLNRRVILIGIPFLILYHLYLIIYQNIGISTDWIYRIATSLIAIISLLTVYKNSDLSLKEKIIWTFGLVFITIIVAVAYYYAELKPTKSSK